MNKKKILSLINGVNLIIVVILVNTILSFYPFLKIDLSKNKVHSLSPTSKNIIKNLDDVVTVKVYASDDLPANIKPLANNLKTILEEFSRINRNKFKVLYFNPSKDQKAKDEAAQLGIQSLQFSSLKSDKYEVSTGYFGLALFYGDKKAVLPVAGDVNNLEYYIDAGIKRILRNSTPEVALVEANDGNSSELQYLRQFLNGNYQVDDAQLNGDEKLPENADTLIVVGQKDKIDDKGITKIKDWVENKKGLIALLDKVSLDQGLKGTAIPNTGLENILKDKGIDLQTDLVIDKSSAYANFQTQNGQFAVQYPLWVQVRPENINQNIPAVSGVNDLMLPWTSSLKINGDAKPLIYSSKDSLTINDFGSLTPTQKFPDNYTGQQILGAINTSGAKIAVIGNSNFIKDRYVSGNSQNLYLVLNMIDYFSQDPSLLTIRSKNLSSSPLMPINDSIKSVLRWGNIILPVVLLAITAVAANIIRKKKNKTWKLYEN